MNDSDKLKKLTEKEKCCSSDKMNDYAKACAVEHGVHIEGDDECRAAKFRLCLKKTNEWPRHLWPGDAEAGECSVCKCEVAWRPTVPGPTVLICIDCALKESDEGTVTE